MDDKICIGCGLCTVQCKFDAITLHKIPDEEVGWGVEYEDLVKKVVIEEAKKAKRLALKKIRA